jgi:protein-disulfide isomerase
MIPKLDNSSRMIGVMATISVICTVAMTLITVRTYLGRTDKQRRRPEVIQASPVIDWRKYAVNGNWMGDKSAKVIVTEFSDFECPYCRKLESDALIDLRSRFPSGVAVVYRHFPSPSHRFAYPAARAAECAGDQERFEEYHNLLFQHQDSLGLITFLEFAKRARVPDLGAFEKCNSASGPVQKIEASITAGKDLGISATPTLLINGTLVHGAIGKIQLDSIISATLAHESAGN